MKEKKWFILGSLVLIILHVLSIINVDKLVAKSIEMYGNLINIKDINTDFYKYFIIIPCIGCIISLIITLALVTKNKINNYKGLFVFIFIINLLFSAYIVGSLISILMLVFCSKIEKIDNKEIKNNVKEEIEKLERCDLGKKYILFGILYIIIYFSQDLFSLITIESYSFAVFMSFLMSFVIMGIGLLIFKVNLKRDVPLFFKNFKKYISYILPKLGIGYLIYFSISLLVSLYYGTNSNVNQQIIFSLPIYFVIPLAVLFAPITEELVFRGCFRRVFKNNIAYIVISSIVFGLLHSIYETSLLSVLIIGLPYMFLGGFFAYLYTKTNNISVNILCHMFHNTLAILVSLPMFF